jgi:hypothetical protein
VHRIEAVLEDEAAPEPTVLHDGLPMLTPLELELADTASLEAPPPLVPWEQTERVLIYGWGEAATAGLLRVLGEAGIVAREASAAEARGATSDMVIVAPLPSMEALGQRVTARVLVAGKTPEQELGRSQAVGALGFLAAPVDPELLLRAVRRLLWLGSDPFAQRA